MKFRFIISLFILLISNSSFSIEIKKLELLAEIPYGSKEGQCGWDIEYWDFGTMNPGPGTIEIGPDGNLYVFDKVNDRINIYDSEGNYLKKLTSKYISRFIITYFADIDDKGNIIALIPPDTIYKVDKKGNLIFTTKLQSGNILSNDIILYKDLIFFYNEDKTIRCITSEGKELNSYQSLTLIKEIDNELINDDIYGGKGLPEEIFKKIDELKNSRKHIILGSISFDSINSKSEDYYTIFENTKYRPKDQIKLKRDKLSGSDFIGFDRNLNKYVSDMIGYNNNVVFVISPYGQLLAVIYFGNWLDIPEYVSHVVAPNGDVYFLYSYEYGIEIKRAKNVWDKID